MLGGTRVLSAFCSVTDAVGANKDGCPNPLEVEVWTDSETLEVCWPGPEVVVTEEVLSSAWEGFEKLKMEDEVGGVEVAASSCSFG